MFCAFGSAKATSRLRPKLLYFGCRWSKGRDNEGNCTSHTPATANSLTFFVFPETEPLFMKLSFIMAGASDESRPAPG